MFDPPCESINANDRTERRSLEHSSNYFRRAKPALLQSVESVGGLGAGERRCDQDLYGSKLSTRMQDTARSAWKASRKFASSVITGGVGGLSACRQCARRRSSAASLGRARPDHLAAGSAPSGPIRAEPLEVSGQPVGLEAAEGGHLSVVEVGASASGQQAPGQQVVVQAQPAALAPPPAASQTGGGPNEDPQQQGLIRVDQNNKLTIVTKFNDSDCQSATGGPGPGGSAPSSSSTGCCSERSRCESSSSGRGTASDAGSAASQNGDLDGAEERPHQPARPHEGGRQRRKSSLFKASKVFGGSQASLGKLRNFFAAASAKSAGGAHHQQQVARRTSLDEAQLSLELAVPKFETVGDLQRQRKFRDEAQTAAKSLQSGDDHHHHHHHNDHDEPLGETADQVGQGGRPETAAADEQSRPEVRPIQLQIVHNQIALPAAT